jgi:polar amino acid transport system substrate-binding protein
MGLSFTGPLFTISEGIAVRATDTTAYRTLADLQGKRVGAPVNTVYVTMLQNAGFTDVRTYANAAEGNGAVIAGEIDVFLQSGPGFLYQHNIAGLWPELRLVDTYVPTTSTVGAIAVRRGDTELLGVLQDAIEAIKADNGLVPILERWALAAPPF